MLFLDRMKWRLVSMFLAACALPVGAHSCSSPDDSAQPRIHRAGEKERAKPAIQRGRFADAVQVGKNRWQLLDDKPPPLEEDDEFSLAGDDDDARPGAGDGTANGKRRPGGQRKKRFGQSPLYVDGVPVAVVAYGELPPWLPIRWVALNDGRKVIRFVMADYLTALGIPLDKVRELHLHGGRGRVGIIPGDELRRFKDRLLFSFTQGDQGKMRMHWDGDIGVSDSIDKVRAVAVYVDRKPPRWDRGQWALVGDDGVKIEGIPYAEAPLRGGVRVYLDGRIAHVLKRNRTFDRKVEPSRFADGVPVFPLFEYLKEVGVDAGRVVAMELLDENKVALRLDRPALAAERKTIELSAPPQSSGHVRIELGPAAGRRAVEVTAVNLYTSRRAAAHERR